MEVLDSPVAHQGGFSTSPVTNKIPSGYKPVTFADETDDESLLWPKKPRRTKAAIPGGMRSGTCVAITIGGVCVGVILLVLVVLGCFGKAVYDVVFDKPAVATLPNQLFVNLDDRYVKIRALTHDILHLELGPHAVMDPAFPAADILTSIMVDKDGYNALDAEPPAVSKTKTSLATSTLYAKTDSSGGVSLFGALGHHELTKITPQFKENADEDDHFLTFSLSRSNNTHFFGLGQEFFEHWYGADTGQLMGAIRTGSDHGNDFKPYHHGVNGRVQIPVLYGLSWLGDTPRAWAVFVDETLGMKMDVAFGDPDSVDVFITSPDPTVRSTLPTRAARLMFIHGATLREVRHRYSGIVGRSPAPPRAAFGPWVSKYGYRDWEEVWDDIDHMDTLGFPLAGVVNDLYWFGGIVGSYPDETASRMGSLRWGSQWGGAEDIAANLTHMVDRGLGMMLIEESYVDDALPEHAALRTQAGGAGLAVDPHGAPIAFNAAWWGTGGMINWGSQSTAAWWHDTHRQPLIDVVPGAIVGHWTDLGEPEMFSTAAHYSLDGTGVLTQDEMHNTYNLRWAASLADGYARHRVPRRPMMLTRSGTAGIQRTGAMSWSGDIAGLLDVQRVHQLVAHNMWLSGIDYYGSDSGGFYRQHDVDSWEEYWTYTLWYGASTLIDMPLRPHTKEDIGPRRHTAPSKIGHIASNLRNTKRKMWIEPTLYSIGLQISRGEDAALVHPPFATYGQSPSSDPRYDHHLIGDDLLAVTPVDILTNHTTVHLPNDAARCWVDLEDGAVYNGGDGPTWATRSVGMDLVRGGLYVPPLLARCGSTLLIRDPTAPTAVGVRVHLRAGVGSTTTRYLTDDGVTLGAPVNTITITQTVDATGVSVTIGWDGPSTDWVIEVACIDTGLGTLEGCAGEPAGSVLRRTTTGSVVTVYINLHQ